MFCDKLRIVSVHNLAIRHNKLTELGITNGRCSSGSPVGRLLLYMNGTSVGSTFEERLWRLERIYIRLSEIN
jgi:hypothetical protein